MACGNPAIDQAPSSESLRCDGCGTFVLIEQQFCMNCGTPNPGARVPLENLGLSVVAALQSVMIPYGSLVLVEKPGSKRSRRCEVRIDGDRRLSRDDLAQLLPLLEETLIWDGYLFAVIQGPDSPPASCVWHVLNGDLFGLSAEHASSLLMYLEALRPAGHPDSESAIVIAAPNLELA